MHTPCTKGHAQGPQGHSHDTPRPNKPPFCDPNPCTRRKTQREAFLTPDTQTAPHTQLNHPTNGPHNKDVHPDKPKRFGWLFIFEHAMKLKESGAFPECER